MNDKKVMIMCEAGIPEDECSDVRVPLGLTLNSQWYLILTMCVDVVG